MGPGHRKGREPPSQMEGLTGGEVTFPRHSPSCLVLTGILYAGHVSSFLVPTSVHVSPHSVQMTYGRQGFSQEASEVPGHGVTEGRGVGPRSSASTLSAAAPAGWVPISAHTGSTLV